MKSISLVVGSGIAGSVLARQLAEKKNRMVLVAEKRNFVGGYCYDDRDENGILIHRYGPHIFRTDSENVWRYLSRFTEWEDYQHKVLANVGGRLYPLPINLDTVNSFLGTEFTSQTVAEYFEHNKTHPTTVNNVRDVVESQIGPEFYHAFFENYTRKQWGIPCEELPPEVVARIPIRKNRDDRYFTNKYQALPKQGYTQMIQNILDHPNIHVLLNTNFHDGLDRHPWEHIYYTGSIDEYYQYRYGKLPYRSVSFRFETYPIEWYQPVSVVNYPNNYDYTRITEFKHFYRRTTSNTVIAKEYPGADGDPSYPIPTVENKVLYEKYAVLPHDNVTFLGRLGEYRYYSMDQIVQKILNLELLKNGGGRFEAEMPY